MNLNEIKASALDALPNEAHTAAQIIAWGSQGRFNSPEGVYLHVVHHKGHRFCLGRFSGWQGDYWMLDCKAQEVCYGSLAYLKDMLRLCVQSPRLASEGEDGEGAE